MEEGRLLAAVKRYMYDWMMLSEEDGQVILYPAVARLSGFYPTDYQNTGEKNI